MPATARVSVGGRTSRPDVQPTPAAPISGASDPKTLKASIRAEIGRLINKASELGGDGYYRQAIRCESAATALFDVYGFINTGVWQHSGEEPPRGRTISEDLAARFKQLPEA